MLFWLNCDPKRTRFLPKGKKSLFLCNSSWLGVFKSSFLEWRKKGFCTNARLLSWWNDSNNSFEQPEGTWTTLLEWKLFMLLSRASRLCKSRNRDSFTLLSEIEMPRSQMVIHTRKRVIFNQRRVFFILEGHFHQEKDLFHPKKGHLYPKKELYIPFTTFKCIKRF